MKLAKHALPKEGTFSDPLMVKDVLLAMDFELMQAAVKYPKDFVAQLMISGAEMLLPLSKALLLGKLRSVAKDCTGDDAKAVRIALGGIERAMDEVTPDLIGEMFEKRTGGDPMAAITELLSALGGVAIGCVLALVCLAAGAPLRLIDAINELQFDDEMFKKIKAAGPKFLECDVEVAIETAFQLAQPIVGPGVQFVLMRQKVDEQLAETIGDALAHVQPDKLRKCRS